VVSRVLTALLLVIGNGSPASSDYVTSFFVFFLRSMCSSYIPPALGKGFNGNFQTSKLLTLCLLATQHPTSASKLQRQQPNVKRCTSRQMKKEVRWPNRRQMIRRRRRRRRRGYTVENTQHTLQRSPGKVTAGEVHPTQGDTNPKESPERQVQDTHLRI